ncbi:MAG: DUF2141 domain-containing protein [Novosphingobium sp.]|nr:DUF2141 domain-containing protein [Novosphingobium sp.]
MATCVSVCGLAIASPVQAQFRKKIDNDLTKCYAGSGPAVMVTVSGINSGQGIVRVQSYRGIESDWLKKGRWISRIEAPARAETMTFCLPVPSPGTYAIAVRHDINGNRKTDITQDGGGMSNNPSINIFNLGKPSYKKTAIRVGGDVKSISIVMKYM